MKEMIAETPHNKNNNGNGKIRSGSKSMQRQPCKSDYESYPKPTTMYENKTKK
jgi:hypothetical protein